MPETAAQRADALAKAAQATEGQGLDVQAEAMNYVMTQPTQAAADGLWKFVVRGLTALLFAALLGLLVMLALGKNIDVLVTIFTATLTGLLGLFVPSPVK